MEKQCYRCGHKMVKAGASSKGYQRYRCTGCGHSYTSKVELANASPRISAQSHTQQSAAPSRLPSVQSSNTVSIRQAPRGNADVQLSDLILTFFFGWLGYWQFKNKKYGLGVVWLLTLGLFGIGWLVDFFDRAHEIYTVEQQPLRSIVRYHADGCPVISAAHCTGGTAK